MTRLPYLDPTRWPEWVKWTMPFVILVGMWVVPSPFGVIVGPSLIGALIWRYGRRTLNEILSWPLPLVALTAIGWWLLPASLGWARSVLLGVPVCGLLYAFMFWTRPTRWWYRWVLRRPFPYDLGPRP